MIFHTGSSKEKDDHNIHQTANQQGRPKNKRTTKMPSKFEDMILYNIFE